VKSADPWVLGKIPTSETIGRTVLVSLPSILFPVFNIDPLTISDSIFLKAAKILFSSNSSPHKAILSSFILFKFVCLLDLSFSLYAVPIFFVIGFNN
jgi:hypothetical protein